MVQLLHVTVEIYKLIFMERLFTPKKKQFLVVEIVCAGGRVEFQSPIPGIFFWILQK